MPHEHRVELATSDGAMNLYEAVPDASAAAAVIVLQEAFGVNDHIEDVTRRFAAQGYRAVAPHLFHRSGDPRLGYDDVKAALRYVGELTYEGVGADLDATLEHLRGEGFAEGHVATVGFCMGGTVSFLAAVGHPLGASVTFYGGGIDEGRFGAPPLIELAPRLQAPWLGLYGDQDAGIPFSEVEQLRGVLGSAPVATEIVRFPHAGHGFHCDVRESYHEDSATDAWARTLAFLDVHLDG